ncbi:hypothetical protein LX36DRAFT_603994, partial [Colletotrichum falcatum]
MELHVRSADEPSTSFSNPLSGTLSAAGCGLQREGARETLGYLAISSAHVVDVRLALPLPPSLSPSCTRAEGIPDLHLPPPSHNTAHSRRFSVYRLAKT